VSLVAWLATGLSLVYLWFAIRNKAVCFVFGIVASLFWAYESYYAYHLVFDAMLQLFYVVMSVLGLYRWKYGGTDQAEKPIIRYTLSTHMGVIFMGIFCSGILIFLSRYVDVISMPVLDATTTVFLVVGTLLLVERELYSWVYLVIADLVYVYIYGAQSAWLFVATMLIYSAFGVMGFINWKKLIEKNIAIDATLSVK